jgi:hypothetical protein
MFRWFWRQMVRQAAMPPRPIEDIGSGLEMLARSGIAGWLLAQERARLDYLTAQERLTRAGTESAMQEMMLRLVRLECTNAVVHSLINEHRLEQLLGEDPQTDETAATAIGKSR